MEVIRKYIKYFCDIFWKKEYVIPFAGISIFFIYFYKQYRKNKVTLFCNKSLKNNKIYTFLKQKAKAYNPTFYLPNFVSIMIMHQYFKRYKIKYETIIHKTKDNAELKIDYIYKYNDKPIIIFICGVNGSSEVIYSKAMAKYCIENEFNIFIVNMRGFYDKNITYNKMLGHVDIFDLEEVVELLNKLYKNNKYICGVSLGANYICKYLGETNQNHNIKGACIISNPFNFLKVCFYFTNTFIGKFIAKFIIKDYKKKINNIKEYHFNYEEYFNKIDLDIKNIHKYNCLFKFDKNITSKISGNDDVVDYYKICNSENLIKHIKIPTIFLNAMDDYLSKKEYIPLEQIYYNKNCYLLLFERGGHIEYFSKYNAEWFGYKTALDYFKLLENKFN